MRARHAVGIALLGVLGLVAIVEFSTAPIVARPPAMPTLELADLLGGSDASFERAIAPRTFRFPQDHGPHPRFRSEWWYYTGNLKTPDGRHFGFQLTFFRFALGPVAPAGASAWRTNQVYLAHFSVTDVANASFHSFERFSRDALGLAGATPSPFRVWLDDWAVEGSGETAFPMRLRAEDGKTGIALELRDSKPMVLQGDRGLSRKSPMPGNASYYYSYPRLTVSGRVIVGGVAFEVAGLAWMDREWSTSALDVGQVGWDWFSIQLEDRREIMFYRLRRRDGSADPMSAGVIVGADGGITRLSAEDVQLSPLGYWRDRAGVRYPVRWSFGIAAAGIDLEVAAYVLDQEHRHSIAYWEGAVSIRGLQNETPVSGDGYLEMTGYR